MERELESMQSLAESKVEDPYDPFAGAQGFQSAKKATTGDIRGGAETGSGQSPQKTEHTSGRKGQGGDDDTYEVDENFRLPAMGVDPKKVISSGLSNGSSMAMQLLVVHSDIFAGAQLEVGGSFATNKFLNKVSDKIFTNLK